MGIHTALRATITKGELVFASGDLSHFAEGEQVIILSREGFDEIAGSDSTRYQLTQKKEELERVKMTLQAVSADLPEQSRVVVDRVLGVKR